MGCVLPTARLRRGSPWDGDGTPVFVMRRSGNAASAQRKTTPGLAGVAVRGTDGTPEPNVGYTRARISLRVALGRIAADAFASSG
jgi:hypothetical protein